MSSKLSKKKKKKPEYGWMQAEIDAMQKKQNERNKLTEMVSLTYHNLKEVSMWVIHDKFGYGKKRLQRVDNTTEQYIIEYADGRLEVDQLLFFVKEKIGIDLSERVKEIPQSYRMEIAQIAMPKTGRDMISTMKSINGAFELWLALICTALYTKEKISRPQINQFISGCVELIDYLRCKTISQEDIWDALKKETGYEIRRDS